MPTAVANDGLGPDGRKKLKNAGVPTNCPLKAATAAAEQNAESLRGDDVHATSSGAVGSGSERCGGSDDGDGIGEAQAGGVSEKQIVGEQLRIGGVDIHGAIQLEAASVLVACADFPGAGDFLFDGEIALLRVAVAKVFCDRQSERQDGQRETSLKIILIGEEGILAARDRSAAGLEDSPCWAGR